MKVRGRIFALSFVSYFVVLFAIPYITARVWADLCLVIFILSVAYQLIYIISLRKKDLLSIGQCLAIYFLYALQALSLFIIVYYVKNFIYGHAEHGLLWYSGDKEYGFDAWTNDFWNNIMFLPVLFIDLCYSVLFFVIKKRKKAKKLLMKSN